MESPRRIDSLNTSDLGKFETTLPSILSRYGKLTSNPPKSIFLRLKEYKWIVESFIELLLIQSNLIDVQNAIINEMNDGVFENNGKPWTEAEDNAVVQWKCDGENVLTIAQGLGRSPAAISTRISTLVGKRRLFINIDGRIVGTLDGEPVDSVFTGIARI